MREGEKIDRESRIVWEGRRKRRLISNHMLFTLLQDVIANDIRFDVRARDHGGGPIGGVNLNVGRVIEEYVDLRSRIRDACSECHEICR